jgi:hypothetical protein
MFKNPNEWGILRVQSFFVKQIVRFLYAIVDMKPKNLGEKRFWERIYAGSDDTG